MHPLTAARAAYMACEGATFQVTGAGTAYVACAGELAQARRARPVLATSTTQLVLARRTQQLALAWRTKACAADTYGTADAGAMYPTTGAGEAYMVGLGQRDRRWCYVRHGWRWTCIRDAHGGGAKYIITKCSRGGHGLCADATFTVGVGNAHITAGAGVVHSRIVGAGAAQWTARAGWMHSTTSAPDVASNHSTPTEDGVTCSVPFED